MNRHTKIRIFALLICGVALTAAHRAAKTESAMFDAANRYLNSMSAEQKAMGQFDFTVKHRTKWHFVPDNSFKDAHGFPRPGLNYEGMNSEQARLAEALLSTGLSQTGFLKAMTVMSLEEVLRVKENDTAGRRDPQKYYFCIYGEPVDGATWAWRVEGHHLSLHYTFKDGRLVSASPTFFGANPHNVKEGPRKGLRTLAGEEDLARALVKTLEPKQSKKAVIDDVAPRDILTRADTRAKLEGEPQGIPASELTPKQYDMLLALAYEYANNMPAEIATERREAVLKAPREEVFFAWAGSIEPGVGDYYRVQGPTFLIEYDNTQNQNNHSHTVWRDYEGDFGFDVLAMHYQMFPHNGGETVTAD